MQSVFPAYLAQLVEAGRLGLTPFDSRNSDCAFRRAHHLPFSATWGGA